MNDFLSLGIPVDGHFASWTGITHGKYKLLGDFFSPSLFLCPETSVFGCDMHLWSVSNPASCAHRINKTSQKIFGRREWKRR